MRDSFLLAGAVTISLLLPQFFCIFLIDFSTSWMALRVSPASTLCFRNTSRQRRRRELLDTWVEHQFTGCTSNRIKSILLNFSSVSVCMTVTARSNLAFTSSFLSLFLCYSLIHCQYSAATLANNRSITRRFVRILRAYATILLKKKCRHCR